MPSDHTLAVFGAIGGIGGILGAIVGFVSLIWARKSANAAERSANAAEDSALTSKEALTHDQTVVRESRIARLRRLDEFGFAHHLSAFNQPKGPVTLALVFFNDGPAVAHNLNISVHWPRNECGPAWWTPEQQIPCESSPILALHPNEKGTLRFQVENLFNHADGWLHLRVSYEDGNGPHELNYWLRVKGYWQEKWYGEVVETEPKDQISIFTPQESVSLQ
jgi:hypothetical protein